MEKLPFSDSTRDNPIALACIVEVSYRLRPVGPGPLSVSISGLPLSWPIPVKGLVGHYPTNSLIGRSPILKRSHNMVC